MLRKNGKGIIILTILLLAALVIALNLPPVPEKISRVKISYQGREAEKIISNSEQLKIFTDLVNDQAEKAPYFWYGHRRVTISLAGKEKYYLFDGKYLYDTLEKTRLKPGPRALEILEKNFASLARETFAPLTPWSEAQKAFPRKSRAKVTDLGTGLSFHVQRRGGTYHADVQPLTAEDTAIMKKIFHGRWTWKRRAIIVETGNKRMAASMNGMPHGQGAIRNNNFPGHFCIHFYNSLTHGSRNRDPAHHIMMLKAAGKIEEHLRHATPVQVATAFWLAVEQQDQYLLKLTARITDKKQLQLLELLDDWADINFSVPETRYDVHNEMLYVVPTKLALLPRGSAKRFPVKTALVLSREDFQSPWLVNLNFLTFGDGS